MKGTIKVYPRLDKTLKSGKAPIELLYSVKNQRKYFNTGEKIYPAYWNKDSQQAFYIPVREAKKVLPSLDAHSLLTELEIDEINDHLLAIRKEIANHERDFVRKEIPFSSQMIIDLIKTKVSPSMKKEEPKEFLFDFIDQYIQDHESTRVPGSLTVYKSVKSHLLAYQLKTKQKVRFNSIDYAFFQRFQNFLINRTKENKLGEHVALLNNTTIAKALSTLKTFLGYAKKQGIKIDDSYKDFVIKREKLEVIALTEDEFQSLLNLDLSNNKRLDQVRDVFCFSCATGLRYSDLLQLRREHITRDEINIIVTKTKTALSIPLNAVSSEILHKYEDQHKPLPVISSQNTNLYLKELCKAAKIDSIVKIVRFKGAKRFDTDYPKYELIHVHTGRKTFCTLSLEKGMSAEQVMAISGHSDYKSFKRYVDVTEKLKKVVMTKAWGEVKKLRAV